MRPGRGVQAHPATAGAPPGLWQHAAWQHPEWWSLALSAIAWLMLLTRIGTGPGSLGSSQPHHHAALAAMSPTGASAWIAETITWLLMVIAMMLPLVLGSVRAVAARSLWPRRDRAIGAFLLGYLGSWLLAGVSISATSAVLGAGEWLRLPVSAAAGFAVAAAWQLAPIKWRALRACHRTTPLAPSGWRADRDCVRYGWTIGLGCLASCWALMLACVLAGHTVMAVACVSTIGITERYLARPTRRIAWRSCGLLFALGLMSAVGAWP